MKKKLFTLLTLLLCVCSGAWGASVSDLTTITSPTIITMDGINGTDALVDKTLYASNRLICLGGCGYSAKKGSTTYDGTTYKNVYQIKNSRQVAIKIGFNAVVTVVGNSDSSRKWQIGTSSAGTEISAGAENETTASGTVDGSSTAKVVYINASGDLYLGAIIITANSSSAINASAATIIATESGVEATQNIDITGANLTGSTLTATLSPAVPGLSVTLASNTITAGAITTTATLHYTQTENAKGSTTLTLSDGTTSKDVTINYLSKVIPYVLQTINSAKTWDFNKLTANTSSERYDSEGIKLTGETTPSISDEVVYENYNGTDITIASGFDGTALAFTGEFPIRKNEYCQNGTLHFRTAYPGTIVVTFSDTGSSAKPDAVKRYLVVNGEPTEYWTSRENNGSENPYSAKLNVTTDAIEVPAGDVTIKGTSALIISKVIYTPLTTYAEIGDKLYRTFASSSALDFSIPVPGLTAYRATVDGDNVSFTEVTGKVPAGEGLLLKADAAGSYTIAKSITTPDAITNALVGVLANTVVDQPIFVLYADETHPIGFYKTTAASFTVNAHTAYLPSTASARSFISLDGETTGIKSMDNGQWTMDNVYDMQGRRVAQPTKGLYIVNGKKVVIK